MSPPSSPAQWSRAARAALGFALPTAALDPAVFADVPAALIAQVAVANQIAGEVCDGARAHGREDLGELLEPTKTSVTVRGLRQLSEVVYLRAVLEERGIASVVMKGLPLAGLTRAQPFLRPSSDIDLLIEPAALVQAYDALTQAGVALLPAYPKPDSTLTFDVYRRFRHESGYSHRGVRLDLHWRLGANFSVYPPARAVIDRSQRVAIGGQVLPAPGSRDALLHATLHWQGSRFLKMKYVLDIVGLLACNTASDVRELPRSSRRVIAICGALAVSGQDWSVPRAPGGRWWHQAVQAVSAPPRDRGSWAAQRRLALYLQLRDTPGIRDRMIVPLRAVSGPLARRRVRDQG